jgi:sugar phosphate isomerase/epimerase
MKASQLAAQLYTVRDHCQDVVGLADSCTQIAAIGYRAVQVSGVGPIPPAEIRRIIADHGLEVCATHEPGAMICDEPHAVVDRLGALGCSATAYPWPHVPLTDLPAVRALAAKLDVSGQILSRAGIQLCYHNHAHEFLRVAGKPVLQWLFDLTDPRWLQAEPDTFWLQSGGVDPARWCAQFSGRLPLLHLKDYRIDTDFKPTVAEVGNGNLDWRGICATADACGTRWFIVEQDTCPGDPFLSLAASFTYLTQYIAVD